MPQALLCSLQGSRSSERTLSPGLLAFLYSESISKGCSSRGCAVSLLLLGGSMCTARLAFPLAPAAAFFGALEMQPILLRLIIPRRLCMQCQSLHKLNAAMTRDKHPR